MQYAREGKTGHQIGATSFEQITPTSLIAVTTSPLSKPASLAGEPAITFSTPTPTTKPFSKGAGSSKQKHLKKAPFTLSETLLKLKPMYGFVAEAAIASIFNRVGGVISVSALFRLTGFSLSSVPLSSWKERALERICPAKQQHFFDKKKI